jgi:hypothetical protein
MCNKIYMLKGMNKQLNLDLILRPKFSPAPISVSPLRGQGVSNTESDLRTKINLQALEKLSEKLRYTPGYYGVES